MHIVARAEPRYYISMSEADAHFIQKLVVKRASRLGDRFAKTSQLATRWVDFLEVRKAYREVCEAAGNPVHTSFTVTASHIELERICQLMQMPFVMDIETAERVKVLTELFKNVSISASSACRAVEVTGSAA